MRRMLGVPERFMRDRGVGIAGIVQISYKEESMDLRDFIGTCEKVGQLKRIKAEVDWDLEISHICKIVEEKSGPALLFENVKGYESPVLTGAFGTTQRLAMILGKSPDLSMVQLTKEWVNLAVKEVIPAKQVKDGPIFENIVEGDKVDTFAFPSPRFYELDGGRYFGTAVFMVIQDPETGDVNLGTYRMGILDQKSIGVQILKGKKGDRIMKKYGKQGKKMPACAIIGGDPLHIFASAATVARAKSGYDVVGTLRGSPGGNGQKPDLRDYPFPRMRRSCWKGRSTRLSSGTKAPSASTPDTIRKSSSSPSPSRPST